MRRIFALLLSVSSQLAHGNPSAAVKSIALAGNGCPSTVAGQADVASDGSTMKVTLPTIVAKGQPRRDARSACNLIVEVTHASGWQVRVRSVSVSIEGALAKDASGDLGWSSHFQGSAKNAEGALALTGAVARQTKTLDLAEAWSTCGERATLVGRLSLTLKGQLSASDHLAAATPVTAALDWRRCP